MALIFLNMWGACSTARQKVPRNLLDKKGMDIFGVVEMKTNEQRFQAAHDTLGEGLEILRIGRVGMRVETVYALA